MKIDRDMTPPRLAPERLPFLVTNPSSRSTMQLIIEVRQQIDDALARRAAAIEVGQGYTGIAEDIRHLAAALADLERARQRR